MEHAKQVKVVNVITYMELVVVLNGVMVHLVDVMILIQVKVIQHITVYGMVVIRILMYVIDVMIQVGIYDHILNVQMELIHHVIVIGLLLFIGSNVKKNVILVMVLGIL